MRNRPVLIVTLAAGAALSLSACGSMKQSVGLSKVVPDEFVTVASAPLVVPPEYGLTPPSPGAPRPQELACLLYTSPSPRDQRGSRMPSSA